MKIAVFFSVLMAFVAVQANEDRLVYSNPSPVNYNSDLDLVILSDWSEEDKTYSLELIKYRSGKRQCEYKSEAVLIDDALISFEVTRNWNPLNQMLESRRCKVFIRIEDNGMLQVNTAGPCNKWCKKGSLKMSDLKMAD